MQLNPYEANLNLDLEEAENFQMHNSPVLRRMYGNFHKIVSKSTENVNTRHRFRLLDYNDFGLKKEGSQIKVTYETLILSLCFGGRDYYIRWKFNFANVFQNLFSTLRHDTIMPIGKLKYFEFLWALPLTVYGSPGGTSRTPHSQFMRMLAYDIDVVGKVDISDIEVTLENICNKAPFTHIKNLFHNIYSDSNPPDIQDISVHLLLQFHILNPIVHFFKRLFHNEAKPVVTPSIQPDSQIIFRDFSGSPTPFINPDIVISANRKPILRGG